MFNQRHHASRSSVSSFVSVLPITLAAALALGCHTAESSADDPALDLDLAPQDEAESDGLPGAKIHAKGSFSCDFGLPGDIPLDQVPAIIERDRMYMAERPGMQTKQLPIGLDFQTGNILSGGRYLFDQAQQAADYADWVRNGFDRDGVLFLERPIFLSPDCHSWEVIGARRFAPIESQVVLRTERWAVSEQDTTGALHARWADVVESAADRGLSAVWLVQNRDEGLVQLVYFADRVAPPDPYAPDFASL